MTRINWQALAALAFNAVIWFGALYLILSSDKARAHEWYPLSCCSNKDCFEIPASEVRATPEGWRIETTGEVIPYERARQTPPEGDGHFHRCSFGGDPSARTIGMNGFPRACFWAPEFNG